MSLPHSPLEKAGDQFRRARMEKGWTLTEARQRTKIPINHLQLLEEGRVGQGTPAAVLRGWVQVYARELGLDVADLMGCYDREFGKPGESFRSPLQPTEKGDPLRSWVREALLKPHAGLILLGVLTVTASLGWALLRTLSPWDPEGARTGSPSIEFVEVSTPAESDSDPTSVPGVESYPLLDIRSVDIQTLIPPEPEVVDTVPREAEELSRSDPATLMDFFRQRRSALFQGVLNLRLQVNGWVGERVQTFRKRILSPERLIPPPPSAPPTAAVVPVAPTPVFTERVAPTSGDPEALRLWAVYQKARKDEVRWLEAWKSLEMMEHDAVALREMPDIAKHSVVQALQTRIAQQTALLERLVIQKGEDDPSVVVLRARIRKQGEVLDKVVLQFPQLVRQRYEKSLADREKAEAALRF